MINIADFKVLTFDCYGTLIDWEAGLLKSLRSLREKAGMNLDDDQILEAFAGEETDQEKLTPSLQYSRILGEVMKRLASSWKTTVKEEEILKFSHSVGSWPAFDDSKEALGYLKNHFRLVILSNIDHDSFASSKTKLGIEFDAAYTAEDIGSYKPDIRNFEYLIEHIKQDFGFAQHEILHIAQSLFHDHIPAKQCGLSTAWIDRRQDKAGWGATKAPEVNVSPDFHFRSMAELVDRVRSARSDER